MTIVKARVEPSLGARVVARTPLFYTAGPDPSLDRPAHVRAGSALARLSGDLFAVVQDDANFVAIVDRTNGRVTAIPLPADGRTRQFDDTRGNKKRKLDLEACFAGPGGEWLVAFGSGSSPARERVALLDGCGTDAARVALVSARDLYAAMRADRSFSGSELNIEGAAVLGDDVVFFQRGNGAASADAEPVDATARVALEPLLAYLRDEGPCPPLESVVAWDLGTVGTKGDHVRLTFTDGATTPSGRLAFLACAEACPDATRDGPVAGVSIGRLDDRARIAEIAPVLDERGAPLVDKAEGLTLVPDDGGVTAFVVIDRDDPDAASELLEIRLGEAWRR